MRFKEQCPECGEYKWCGHDCERKPPDPHISQEREIEIRAPISFKVDGTELMPKKQKFDRRAHMRAYWEKRRNARFDQ